MLTHLEGRVRLMQACAQRTALEGGARLPACGEKTRIERVAGALMDLGAGDLSDLQLGADGLRSGAGADHQRRNTGPSRKP